MTGESASVSCSLLEKLLEFCGGQSQKLESKATDKSVRPPWTSGMDWGRSPSAWLGQPRRLSPRQWGRSRRRRCFFLLSFLQHS